ncbi:MAG: TadE family type IV pilus minor pilin [Actinomyces urogenitalis]|uniref:TadE family type IV pilus minor pilin n=1 Tax=Actinomyces urogenitalis TaxID=103621 RepID=UPI002A81D111|nr:TadE family type IV pilus minor pilin [Actinomyces urogenitalis]MDY3679577.1 TadE family type IV pilus minor pilin [Actinomyces urogenitalis]
MGTSPAPGSGETGMVTAETAVVLPSVIIVLALALSAISAGATQLRVTDAARSAARAAALGRRDLDVVVAAAAGHASLAVERGELTCVTVSRPVPGPVGGLGLTARSRACAWTEPEEP